MYIKRDECDGGSRVLTVMKNIFSPLTTLPLNNFYPFALPAFFAMSFEKKDELKSRPIAQKATPFRVVVIDMSDESR